VQEVVTVPVVWAQLCAQVGKATDINAKTTAAASIRDFGAVFGSASTAPTVTPPGALASSETTCGTPSVRLKTMR